MQTRAPPGFRLAGEMDARAFDYMRGCRIGEASNPGPDANRPKGKQPARTRAPDALETASEDAVDARQHKATYPPQPKQFAHKGGKVTTRGGLPAEAIEAGKRLRRLEKWGDPKGEAHCICIHNNPPNKES